MEKKGEPTKKTFATNNTESFAIPGFKESDERVVINIQEERPSEAIILDNDDNAGAPMLWYKKINFFLVSHSKVKIGAKSTFYHLLSVMINAGIPMVRALRSLAVQEKNAKMVMIILSIADQIERGKSLSESLLSYPDVFLDQEIGMVRSGEASGQLGKVMESISDDLGKADSIQKKVKSAMIYPTMIFILLIGVVTAMLVFVIPKLTSLFSSNQLELPLITRIVVASSNFMVNQSVLLIVGTLLLVLFFMLFRSTTIGRYLLDSFKIKVPIFGSLFQKAYLSRFARSLSNLLDSNISIVKTIEIAANSMGNEVYRKRLLLASEDIKQGIPLAETLTESPLFPPMLVNMIDVGEKTAQLESITAKVATFYENEVDTAVEGISKIIEPVILVFIGLVVGTIVAAIMLPIMQLSDLAGLV